MLMEFISLKEIFAVKYTEKHTDTASDIETNGYKDRHAKRVTDVQKQAHSHGDP